MKMYKSIFIREFKLLNYKSMILVFFLTSILLFMISLGQIFTVREYFNIDVTGISNIIYEINNNSIFVKDFQNRLISYAFLVPCVLYFFYLGFPYLLKSYSNEKSTKNLFHLFITPLKIKYVITTISVFSTLTILVPSIFILIVNNIAFTLMGMTRIININLLLYSVIVMSVLLFSISNLLTGIFWLTNCNKAVTLICRILIMLGMSSIYLVMGANLNLTLLLNAKIGLMIFVISIIIFIVSNILNGFISKETSLINE